MGGYFTSLTNFAEVTEYVSKLASTMKARRIAVSGAGLSSPLLVPKLLIPCDLISLANMERADFFEALKSAEIGVTCADLGVAETGTLIIATTDELDRLVTALPLLHVAILPRSKLVFALDDAQKRISQLLMNTSAAVSISLISASSRTSDVGGISILGAHGPKELHVLLLDQDLPGGL
ncbi:MAG: LUD domain-containing protein [Candidatus Bathyarchaeia archaeon]